MSVIREPKGILPYSPENYPEKIPEFASEEEARVFFDTHDTSFYDDQFETVVDYRNDFLPDEDRKPSTARRRPGSEAMELLSVRFPTSMIEGIKAVATKRHLPYQTLLRSWVGERLQQELDTITQSPDMKAS